MASLENGSLLHYHTAGFPLLLTPPHLLSLSAALHHDTHLNLLFSPYRCTLDLASCFFSFLFFSLLFCLLHVIPYWSGVIIILEHKDDMYLVAAPRLAWFQGFIACVIFLYVHVRSMLCYDYYYVLLFGMVILLRSPLPGWSLLVSFFILVPGFHFWCLGEKSGLIYRFLAFVRNSFSF